MSSWFKDVETCRPAFDAKSTPRISYGLRFPDACAKHVHDDLASHRIYIIASRSLSLNTDALDKLKSSLGDLVVGVHVGISPHTPIEEIVAIVDKAKALEIDCIITLGAGSITDGAKLVRFSLANKAYTSDEIRSLRGKHPHDHLQPTIPLICIPTTLSGGEYQAIAGATDERTREKVVFDPVRDPDLVIQDPELCITTPERVWLSTGVRAIDHCVETLCSLQSNDTADSWARRGLVRLAEALLRCKNDPSDLEARHQCQLGVVEAMRAVSCGVPLGASHAIGHQLGSLGVPHGETSCILLPAVCSFNAQETVNAQKQATVAQLLLDSPPCTALLAAKCIDRSQIDLSRILNIFLREINMPRSLKDVGIVGEDKLRQLVENSLKDIWIKTNAIPITQESQVMEILRMVE